MQVDAQVVDCCIIDGSFRDQSVSKRENDTVPTSSQTADIDGVRIRMSFRSTECELIFFYVALVGGRQFKSHETAIGHEQFRILEIEVECYELIARQIQ